ncbi:MAG: hypothetical protein NDI94_02840 [Candidatus Woesearchaeota archaeon]|nr:hypothetical protein [Candidatus Woesearchaeota archaeon]
MRDIRVIGTVHGYVEGKELIPMLYRFDPDQVLLEVVHKDFAKNSFDRYPREMIQAYKWSIANRKDVRGFDCEFNIAKKITPMRQEELEERMQEIIDRYGWIELNKKKYDHIFDSMMVYLIDMDRHRLRQKQMLKTIEKVMMKDGKVLIICGIGHLEFFEKHLKDAKFILRD